MPRPPHWKETAKAAREQLNTALQTLVWLRTYYPQIAEFGNAHTSAVEAQALLSYGVDRLEALEKAEHDQQQQHPAN